MISSMRLSSLSESVAISSALVRSTSMITGFLAPVKTVLNEFLASQSFRSTSSGFSWAVVSDGFLLLERSDILFGCGK